MAEDNVTSRRTFLKQLAGLTGAALVPQLAAPQTVGGQGKATQTLLLLVDRNDNKLPIDLDVTSMPEIPRGWEWAKAPVAHLIEGFKAIRERERKVLGAHVMFERYARDRGIFAVTEEGRFGGVAIPGDSTYSRLPTEKGNYPVILFDARRLNDVPKNAGFYAAHEMAHHFNYLPGVFDKYSAEQVEQAGPGALVHSAHPLFGIAVNMDYADLMRQGRQNESLLSFTQFRAFRDPAMEIQIEREKEFLADAVGSFLSGVHPDFPRNAMFTKNQKPLNSPLVKRYVEDVFLYDIALRNTPTPANNKKRQDMYALLADPKRVLGDEASFRYVGGIDDQFARTQTVAAEDLRRCESIMGKTLDAFQKQRNAQMGTPGRP
jgi:hypothetical protein